MAEIKLDFHRNGWLVQQQPSNPIKGFLLGKLEGHPKTLKYIADNLYSPDENRGIVLLDYYDFHPKFKGITSDNGLREVERGGYEIDMNSEGIFIGLTANEGKSWLYVANGTEVMSRQGHFIAAFIPPGAIKFRREDCYYPNSPDLGDKLKEARDNDAIIIPTHPVPRFGMLTKAILMALKEPSGTNLGIGKDDLVKYKDFFDAIEIYSLSMDDEQVERARNVAEELDLPMIANSDSPISSGMLSHNRFQNIDFSSAESVRRSIRERLSDRDYDFEIVQPKSVTREKLEHILINFLCKRENF